MNKVFRVLAKTSVYLAWAILFLIILAIAAWDITK
jgi:hypothetical protein